MSKKPRKKKKQEPDYLKVLQDWVDTIRHDSDDPQAEAKRFCLSVKALDNYLEESESDSFESSCLTEVPMTPAHGYTEADVMTQTKAVVDLINAGDLGNNYDQVRDLAYKAEGHIYCDAQRLAALAIFIRHCESEAGQ